MYTQKPVLLEGFDELENEGHARTAVDNLGARYYDRLNSYTTVLSSFIYAWHEHRRGTALSRGPL